MSDTPYWKVLASDFDGTLASHGIVAEETYAALARARAAGIAVLLVTGREMRDFGPLGVRLEVFDCIVAENGAVLHIPSSGAHTLLAPAPSQPLIDAMVTRGITDYSAGQTILATWVPHETVVLECIKELGLELTITFNKGAVMVLPPGVNKASGLKAALGQLGLDVARTVGVGDAENDHAFLTACGCAVAVANALDSLKETAHFVTTGRAGEGVAELIDLMIEGRLPQPGEKTS